MTGAASAAETVAARLPGSVPAEAVDAGHCRVFASGDTAYSVAMNLPLLGQEFVVENASPAVRAALAAIGQRAAQAGRDSDFLPAALAPFGQVRALGAERGVATVAGADPGGVGRGTERLLRHVVEQGREPGRVLLRVADAAGEQAATGALARRRWRTVALLATVVSPLTRANGLGGARGSVHR